MSRVIAIMQFLHAQEHPPYTHCGHPLIFIENLLFKPLAFHCIKVF